MLYRVRVATNAAASNGSAFVVETTTPQSGWTQPGALQDGNAYFYLVTTISPQVGEGPRGHHGQ